MIAEFEEKMYEQHLNLELLEGSNLIFPPGQVLEHTLGFDVALFTGNPMFWKNFPLNYPRLHNSKVHYPLGIKISVNIWKNIINIIDTLPPFKFNAFIQYKRPEYLIRANSQEWDSWKNPYFRYDTISHQQEALYTLENNIKDSGIVVYACPAFHTLHEFWDNVVKRTFIEQSNFCQPTRLFGHNRFTFCDPGTHGIAHSEPEEVESYDILKRMEELRITISHGTNSEFILSLGENIDSILIQNKGYKIYYSEMCKYLLQDLDNIPVAIALVKIDIFRMLTRTSLFIGTKPY